MPFLGTKVSMTEEIISGTGPEPPLLWTDSMSSNESVLSISTGRRLILFFLLGGKDFCDKDIISPFCFCATGEAITMSIWRSWYVVMHIRVLTSRSVTTNAKVL